MHNIKLPSDATSSHRADLSAMPCHALPKSQEYPTGMLLTGNHFWALEVLIGMDVAGREGKIQTDEDKQQIEASPHISNQCSSG